MGTIEGKQPSTPTSGFAGLLRRYIMFDLSVNWIEVVRLIEAFDLEVTELLTGEVTVSITAEHRVFDYRVFVLVVKDKVTANYVTGEDVPTFEDDVPELEEVLRKYLD